MPKLRFPEFWDAGEWEEKELSEICEINPSVKSLPEKFVYIDLESVEAGQLLQKKIISRNGAPSRAQRLLKKGDVVFQMVRPYQKNNYFFLPDDDLNYVASTGYAQLRAYESNKYLFQYLHDDGFVGRVLAKCTGSNYPAINSSDLAKILVQVPEPKEQQKIADCLSSHDALITAHSQKLETLKAHKKGLMQQLFPREGETFPRLRFPEFRDAGEWEEKKLGDAAVFLNGRAYKKEELLTKGKYRVLRVGNFFSNDEWYYSDLELDENKYCDDGDLLYAWSASFGPRIWRGEKVIYHYHIWKVVANKGVDKKFLYILLEYETERMKSSSANGLGLLHITKNTIENWESNFPKIEEQKKIADCLSSIDALIAAQDEKVEALKAHKKGLMQQFFPSPEDVGA